LPIYHAGARLGQRWRPSSNETIRMIQNGMATFASPDAYGAAIGAAKVELFITSNGAFKGQLTHLDLGCLNVLRGRENLPRIAFLTLPPAHVHISFSTNRTRSLIYCGLGLNFGDLIFHSLGQKAHQRTVGEGDWYMISLPPDQLIACSKTLIGETIRAPSQGYVLVPGDGATAVLLGLVSQACQLAERAGELISKAGAASLERELLHALVKCLSTRHADGLSNSRLRHADIMLRFEECLARRSEPHLNLSELCSTIGVPERTLRVCCAEFLGVSPSRYYLLRRLNRARSALSCADPESASVSEIARNHHFTELGRFAVAYRDAFGETPSSTLRRVSNKAE
jgi:AraC-like DNA-binding protein